MIYDTFTCATVSAGYSPAADIVNRLSNEARKSQLETVTFGDSYKNLHKQLNEVFTDCSVEGWDGYGASPVSKETFGYALFFIYSLPLGFPAPEIGADPDGHLNFEWYKDPRHIVSVSVSPEGKLYYAALNGEEKIHGTEFFSGEIPQRILDIIHKVFWNEC